MAKFTNLRVWQQSRELLRLVSAATADMRGSSLVIPCLGIADISIADDHEGTNAIAHALQANDDLPAAFVRSGIHIVSRER